MNQADVSRLVSQLRIKINPRYRNLKNPRGSEGRLDKLRQTVTGLFKYERIELNYNRADEARGYAERLISEAIRHGDKHIPTMEMADFWLQEKQLVHKLFKVLAPRYENYTSSYTRLLKVSSSYPIATFERTVLELKGNPYPSLIPDFSHNRNLLHNILLDAAKKDYRTEKIKELGERLGSQALSSVGQEKASSENTVESSEKSTTESQESIEQTPSSAAETTTASPSEPKP